MAITTYDELQSAVARWLRRDDLVEYIPDFITLAEARHRREIRCEGNEGRWRTSQALPGTDALGVPNVATRYLGRPDDYIGFRMVRIIDTSTEQVKSVPKTTSPEELSYRLKPGYGLPSWYATHATIEFDIIPTPGVYKVEVLYYRSFPHLSETVPTNWLLENAPDLYLYGALLDSAPLLRDDDRLGIWQAFYEEKKGDLVKQYEDSLYSMGSLESHASRTVI